MENKKEKNWIIQKSNPLISLSETGMSLVELKILDTYLSRINSHDSNKRSVRFERGDLEKLLNLSKIPLKELSNRLEGLFKVVTIKDDAKTDGFTKIALFEKAEAKKDEKGLWQVDLCCTQAAQEYIFNIENIGFLKYKLANIVNIKSRYSYILYLYLESNKFRQSWTIDVEELKKILNCTAETYKSYKRFNGLILAKCQKEIQNITDIKYEYEGIRKGKSVQSIKFTIISTVDVLPKYSDVIETSPAEKTENNKDLFIEEEIEYGGELANLLGNCALNNEFNCEEVRVIQDILLNNKKLKRDDLEYCNYLMSVLNKMNYQESKKPIKNRFKYLCQMLENDKNN